MPGYPPLPQRYIWLARGCSVPWPAHEPHRAWAGIRSYGQRIALQESVQSPVSRSLEQSDQGSMAYPKHTSPSSQRDSGYVTVTHPSHPLCGQQVEIIRVRRGPDPDLIIRHLDGYHGAIAASWTSYASAGEALASEKPPLLDLEGLCHLA